MYPSLIIQHIVREGGWIMTIMNTVKWLKEISDLKEVYSLLKPYFHGLNEREIKKQLQAYGMYKHGDNLKKWINHTEKNNILSFLKQEEKMLKDKWNGPNIPIFIFPCDEHNRKIASEYNGRAGVAFNNKLFLFLSSNISKKDIKPLLIHEYHHVCRLAAIDKNEKDFTLLDTIILEGMAENAVREELGEEATSSWSKRYNEAQCSTFYKNIIKPNQNVSRENPKYTQLLYGTGFYPNMVGYSVGFYLVKKYMDVTGKSIKEIFSLPASVLVEEK